MRRGILRESIRSTRYSRSRRRLGPSAVKPTVPANVVQAYDRRFGKALLFADTLAFAVRSHKPVRSGTRKSYLTSRETYKILGHARNAAATFGGKKVKEGWNKDKNAGDPHRDQRDLCRRNEASVPRWMFITIAHLRAPAIFLVGPNTKCAPPPASQLTARIADVTCSL